MVFVDTTQFSRKILSLRLLLALIVLGAAGWYLNLAWEKARTVTYVIPAGTSEALASGQELVEFPTEIILTVGLKDRIVIENRDDAVHAFGPFTILPHTTLIQRFKSERVYQNSCTFHQNRQMTLRIQPAPWDLMP